jgi:orotate phosphoribosyltransferase
MDEKEVLSIFKKEQAFLTGHFLLSSGLHSPNYMQCALVLQKPAVAEKLCRELAKPLKSLKADLVLGPALGGMIVAYEMGRALGVRASYEVIELLKREGGRLAGVACLVDRSDGAAIFEQDLHALMKIQIKSYKPEQCPLCRERKIPLTKPGSRGLRLTV